MSVSSTPILATDITLPATDGTLLKAWYWARPSPTGLLVIAHGLGEHGGCYRHLVESLAPSLEIDVLAFDFRGHGRSPGRRGLVLRFEELLADLRGAWRWAVSAGNGHLPRFLLGHSNGGLVALKAVVEGMESLRGLILSNPVLVLATPVPGPKRVAGAVLRRVAPWITLGTAIGGKEMTRDPEMIAEREADRLRHSRISAGIFYGMLEGGPAAAQHASAIRVPLLMILGGSDPVVDARASVNFFERLGSTDKTLRLHPEMLHEPLNEVGRELVIAEIKGWLAAHIRTALHPL
jgi:alpha-beta hydrolase superfamily lysophospholipase